MAYCRVKMRFETRTKIAFCIALAAGASGAHAQEIKPAEDYLEYRDRQFRLSYPQNWQTFGDRDSVGVTIAPEEAMRTLPRGGTSVGIGAVVSFYYTEGKAKLDKTTKELVERLQGSNPGLQVAATRQKLKVDRKNARLTILRGPSHYEGQTEVNRLVTVAISGGLFYIVFVAPEEQASSLQPVFDRMLASLKFSE